MAHKKAGGSTRNGRDSNPKYLGVTVYGGQASEAGIRQEQRKEFYVSPFLDFEMTYHFRIRPPRETVAVRILETDGEDPVLAATFHGHWRKAGTREFALAILQTLGIPWKVTVGIHLEALRLWLKGLKVRSRPQAATLGYTFNRRNAGRG